MEYSIGEIAKLFGLSKEAIRHYERLNIIHSKRNPHNNYRFYDEETVTTLRMLRSYRSQYFSLEEAVSLIHAQEQEDMLEELHKKENDLQHEIDALNKSIQVIKQQKDMIQNLQPQIEKFQIETKPPMLWFSYNHESKKDSLYQETELCWTNHMPNVRISARFQLNQGSITSIPGFCISLEDAKKASLALNPYVEEIPACRAFHTVMTSELPFGNQIDVIWINKLLQVEKEQDLQTSNEILSVGIVRIGKKYYFDIWHPLM